MSEERVPELAEARKLLWRWENDEDDPEGDWTPDWLLIRLARLWGVLREPDEKPEPDKSP
jgi:hypothetical protein